MDLMQLTDDSIDIDFKNVSDFGHPVTDLLKISDVSVEEFAKLNENIFLKNFFSKPCYDVLTGVNISTDFHTQQNCSSSNMSYLDNSSLYTDSIFNFSIEKALEILMENDNGYLNYPVEVCFTVCYVLLILFGVIGNSMVCYVIWRKKTMRTARNLYVINLTLSDLTMCIISMPFTLVGLINKDWSFGSAICKLIPVIQGTNILVSTATIVAIAADRHFTIVRVGRSNRKKWHVAGSLGLIWIFSLIFTLPLYSYYFVEKVKFGNFVLFRKCVEKWPSRFVKEVWVLLLLLTQYIFPIFVLIIVHGSIKRYLGQHITVRRNDRRAFREMYRNKRTTILLSTIAIAFAVSWLPWHVVNLLADFNYYKFKDPSYLYTVFGSCHIIAMTSACFNPVLYGWLNTNLRRELLEFLPRSLKKMRCIPKLSENIEIMSQTNKTNNNNGESQNRPPESITLYVYQQPTNVVQQTEEIPPLTTSISLLKDLN
ncbi:UNVERIFIED_CONTAM: hypothetical protein RMT77_013585 [Armadillidium vulgare]